MNYGCTNQVVVITGGTSGIGKACGEILAAEGALVFALARHEVVTTSVKFIKCDVTKRTDVKEAFEQVISEAGRIDIVINCAGVYKEQRFETMQDEDYHMVMDTNVYGTFLTCQYALKHMIKGTIVNVASDAAVHGNYGCSLYSASKGAVVAFTKSLALDTAPYIRVNCVCPGDVDTPLLQRQCEQGGYTQADCAAIYPLQKVGTTAEVAHVICSVVSPANGFMTGSVILVAGGIGI